jgi:hypothetical protein
MAALRTIPPRPLPVLDTVLGWVASEARRYRPPVIDEHPPLRVRGADAVLVALALAPLVVLVA